MTPVFTCLMAMVRSSRSGLVGRGTKRNPLAFIWFLISPTIAWAAGPVITVSLLALLDTLAMVSEIKYVVYDEKSASFDRVEETTNAFESLDVSGCFSQENRAERATDPNNNIFFMMM